MTARVLGPEDECRHGLLIGTCTICKRGLNKHKPEATMQARHDSRCPVCGSPINEGDTIGLSDLWWVCSRCCT